MLASGEAKQVGGGGAVAARALGGAHQRGGTDGASKEGAVPDTGPSRCAVPAAGDTGPLADALRRRVHVWRAMGAPAEVLRWISRGVEVDWGPLGPPGAHDEAEMDLDAEQLAWWRGSPGDESGGEEARLTQAGAFRALRPGERMPTVISGAFLVPKMTDGVRTGWRLVINLKWLNTWCRPLRCRFESLGTLRRISERGDYYASFDLADGYYAVQLSPESQKYFGFRMAGRVYVCTGLPMGWLNSPYVFTKLLRPVVRFIRSQQSAKGGEALLRAAGLMEPAELAVLRGVDVIRGGRRRGANTLPYLDDFLLVGATRRQTSVLVCWVQRLLGALGLRPHPRKCHWEPTQVIRHLGLMVDAKRGVFTIPADKKRKIATRARELYAYASGHRRWAPARHVAEVAGLCQSVLLACPEARLFLRRVHEALRQVGASEAKWAGAVRLSNGALKDLRWWARIAQREHSGPIWLDPRTATMKTDASLAAWGAEVNGRAYYRGQWGPEETTEHINVLEVRAVRRALEAAGTQVQGQVVRARIDSQVAIGCIKRWGSRSVRLNREVLQLWLAAQALRVQLRPEYIRTTANKAADHLSRTDPAAEACLPRDVFLDLDRAWGPFVVDRFAHQLNRQVEQFNTLVPAAGAPYDAFAQDWADVGGVNYAFPPVQAIGQVLALLRVRPAPTVLVTPRWETAPWWPELRAQAAGHRELGRPRLVEKLSSGERALDVDWALSAWLLCASTG
ncbi:unnamed protein product [Pedinophyceae sp. YPF-701]|nr:unnamed protein product [Pedinophyceae sp. YPF-701]